MGYSVVFFVSPRFAAVAHWLNTRLLDLLLDIPQHILATVDCYSAILPTVILALDLFWRICTTDFYAMNISLLQYIRQPLVLGYIISMINITTACCFSTYMLRRIWNVKNSGAHVHEARPKVYFEVFAEVELLKTWLTCCAVLHMPYPLLWKPSQVFTAHPH